MEDLFSKCHDLVDIRIRLYTEPDMLNYIDLKKVINHYKNYLNSNNRYYKIHLFTINNMECFFILWDKNSESKIHDHPENGCVFKVLYGSLDEVLYNTNDITIFKENQYDTGYIGYIDNKKGYHKIMNKNHSDYTVSIHFYSPPGYVCKEY